MLCMLACNGNFQSVANASNLALVADQHTLNAQGLCTGLVRGQMSFIEEASGALLCYTACQHLHEAWHVKHSALGRAAPVGLWRVVQLACT